MKLTIKQKKFADEYIICGNATEAAKKAGYSKKTANKISTRNLSKPAVKDYIEQRLRDLDSGKIMEQREVLERLTKFARREEQDEVVVMQDKAKFDTSGKFLGIEKVPLIVKVTVASKDSIKALELLGKRYRLFTERSEAEEEQIEKLDKIIEAIDNEAKR